MQVWIASPVSVSHSLTVPSSLAEASCLPPGEKDTATTGPRCPTKRLTSSPVPTSQSRRAFSSGFGPPQPAKADRPSGENATQRTQVFCRAKRRTSLPLATSHNRTYPSRLPDNTRSPCGDVATLATSVAGMAKQDSSSWRSSPVRHSRTVPSAPPETARLPVGENARQWTAPVWPTSRAFLLISFTPHRRRLSGPQERARRLSGDRATHDAGLANDPSTRKESLPPSLAQTWTSPPAAAR